MTARASSAIGKRDAKLRNYYWCTLCGCYTPAYPQPDGKGCKHDYAPAGGGLGA